MAMLMSALSFLAEAYAILGMFLATFLFVELADRMPLYWVRLRPVPRYLADARKQADPRGKWIVRGVVASVPLVGGIADPVLGFGTAVLFLAYIGILLAMDVARQVRR